MYYIYVYTGGLNIHLHTCSETSADGQSGPFRSPELFHRLQAPNDGRLFPRRHASVSRCLASVSRPLLAGVSFCLVHPSPCLSSRCVSLAFSVFRSPTLPLSLIFSFSLSLSRSRLATWSHSLLLSLSLSPSLTRFRSFPFCPSLSLYIYI